MEPMTLTFEEMMPFFKISGTASIFEGPMPPHPDTIDPTDGTRTIRTGQDWWALIQWTATGWMNLAIDGTWNLQVFLEKMGIGEFQLMNAPRVVPFVSANPHTYTVDIPFVAQSISVPAGLYKVAVSLTMRGPTPTQAPLPIAAVAEGPVLQFYDAVGP